MNTAFPAPTVPSAVEPVPWPAYYTSLAQFLHAFEQARADGGLPILTYHKLGPRPRGVRLKGLYVSRSLFEVQLRELRSAGFATVVPRESTGSVPRSVQSVMITFDDGFENVLRHGLAPLQDAGFRAIQFLVADRIGGFNSWEQAEGESPERLMDESQVREWMAAGHMIGAHSCTHPHLTRLSPAAAREEIGASRRRLEDRFGVEILDFCYPYGDCNPAVRDCVGEAGFKTAYTTRTGLSFPSTDPLLRPRFTARYASRNWAWIRRLLLGRVP